MYILCLVLTVGLSLHTSMSTLPQTSLGSFSHFVLWTGMQTFSFLSSHLDTTEGSSICTITVRQLSLLGPATCTLLQLLLGTETQCLLMTGLQARPGTVLHSVSGVVAQCWSGWVEASRRTLGTVTSRQTPRDTGEHTSRDTGAQLLPLGALVSTR